MAATQPTVQRVPVFDPAHPDARAAAQVSGALYGQPLLAYIQQAATRYGLDPNVPLAVAPHEGGFEGAVGDNNTSFGPWQLHMGGALPSTVASQGADYAKQWANSPDGLNYALQHIAQAIHGAKGAAGVQAVVTQFERPAAQYVAGEVAKALQTFGGGAPTVPAGTAAGNYTVTAPAPAATAALSLPKAPVAGGQVGTAAPILAALRMLGVNPGALR